MAKSEEKSQKDELLAKNELIAAGKKDSFSQYLQEIHKFPILTAEEEYQYAKNFQEKGDKEAAKMLVQSHLRLVVKIAAKFKNYGLPVKDLVSEGNVGLVKAVKKFDPDRGFRFSTYAMWWIRASVQEYLLRSWSLVKIGTTAAQKKLFFNLHKIKRRLGSFDGEKEASLDDEQVKKVAKELDVGEKEVKEMDSRLGGGDISLNSKVGGDDNGGAELAEIIVCEDDNQEQKAIDLQEKQERENLLREAFLVLNERERDILIKRQMSEVSSTLEELSTTYNISRERIRQVEQNALNKIKKEIARLKGEES